MWGLAIAARSPPGLFVLSPALPLGRATEIRNESARIQWEVARVAAVEARRMFDDKEGVAPAAKERSGGPHIVCDLGRRVLSVEGLGSS